MKRLTAIVLVLALTLCACGQKADSPADTGTANPPAPEESSSGETRVIRIAASDPADYPLCKADTYFQEVLGELSGGKIEVQTFFDGILGEESDTVESCKLGMLELTRVSAGNMANFVPELALFNLPFLFKDRAHFNTVIDGEAGEIYEGLFENAGLKLLSFYEEGTRNIFAIKAPITTPEELKGVKIRTMGAQSVQDGFSAMGASPTPMNSGEVFTSLSQGLLDACENNYSTIYALRWFESAKYFTNTEHLRVPSVVCCSLDYWNSLSAEEQAWIQEALQQAKAYAADEFQKGEEEAFEALLAEGCQYTELTEEQRDAFADKCKDIYQKYATTEESKKILNLIQELK